MNLVCPPMAHHLDSAEVRKSHYLALSPGVKWHLARSCGAWAEAAGVRLVGGRRAGGEPAERRPARRGDGSPMKPRDDWDAALFAAARDGDLAQASDAL